MATKKRGDVGEIFLRGKKGSARRQNDVEDTQAARPDWMRDPSLLPRTPPPLPSNPMRRK